jgi:hypothetical protein
VLVVADLSAAVVVQQEQQVLAQVALAELAISTLAVLAHQEQELLLAVAAVEQGFHLTALRLLQTMVETVELVVAVGVVLLLAELLALVVAAKFDFTTKEF